VIPTRHKNKLGHTLTWPIGASAISDALANASHVDALELWFADSPVFPASRFRRILKGSEPYAVMVAAYDPPTRYAQALHLVRWSVRVNPVLRPLRSTVNALLRPGGLRLIEEWLRASDAVGWVDRHHRLELIFAPSLGTLSRQTFDGV
jgi:hypothetical protein